VLGFNTLNEALKRRLTGAAVLLILAGFLWPVLFDFDEATRTPVPSVNIPDMPSAVAVNEADADAKRLSKTSKIGRVGNEQAVTERLSEEAEDLAEILKNAAETAVAVVARPGSASQKSQPRLDQNKIPVSYVVQVATFNGWNNAQNFKETLLAKKFKAYVKPATDSQAGPYRIAVGPVLTYAEAEEIVAKIQREHKVNDAIIRRLRDV